MKKILFVAMAAIMLLGMFGSIKTNVKATNANGIMAMNPTDRLVNTITSSDTSFVYNITLSGVSVSVSGWDAKLYWDASVLCAIGVVWGNFFNGHGALTINATYPVVLDATHPATTTLELGQSYASQPSSYPTGGGWLAGVVFAFILPGATTVNFDATHTLIFDNNNAAVNVYDPTGNGRVHTDFPRPVFTWKTADGMNPLPAANTTNVPASRSPGTGQIYDGGRAINVSSVATTVIFSAAASYDVTNMVWNGTAYNLVGGAGLTNYVWDFGDGLQGSGLTTTHQYMKYKQAGYVVSLLVTDNDARSWNSTWRYGGPDPSNTVPMWRDVAIVDIWPSLPPYATWDLGTTTAAPHTADADWWNSWYFTSTDFWMPNTADKFWNYNQSNSWEDENTGVGLPTPDIRLLYYGPGAYANGSSVKPTDTDVGNALTPLGDYTYLVYPSYRPDGTSYGTVKAWFNDGDSILTNYYDTDASGGLTPGDSLVHCALAGDSVDGLLMNSTRGDYVIYGTPVPNGAKLSFFTYEAYYDANSNGNYNARENIYWDEADASGNTGAVSGAPNLSVAQAAAFVGGESGLEAYGLGAGGMWVLVTANNFGSVTESCTINLYAIGIALKTGSPLAGVYPIVQVASFDNIGTWTTKIRPGTGTGWSLATGWIPKVNATFILMATITPSNGAAIADQDLSNNVMFLNTPVSNIATFNSTSGTLVNPAYTNIKYLCDFANKGAVGPADLAYLISQYGSAGKAGNSVIPISKP